MSVKQDDVDGFLDELATGTSPITLVRLSLLSDLHGETRRHLELALASMPTDRRRHLLRSLVEVAESNFEVNFDVIYRHCLDDEDGVVRATAVDGLWEDNSPALIGPFLTMARSDPSPLARAAAAGALGRFVLAGELEQLEPGVEMRIVGDLLSIVRHQSENAQVRRRALESVAYACAPEITEALEFAYYDEVEEMRLGALVGMGRSCDRRWGLVLLEELASHSPAMRYEAALACGELMMRKAVPSLARLLHDADRQVCYASIWALGQIGGSSARQVLLAAYDTADEDTEAALDEALAEQSFSPGHADLLFNGAGEGDEEDWTDGSADLVDDDELDGLSVEDEPDELAEDELDELLVYDEEIEAGDGSLDGAGWDD